MFIVIVYDIPDDKRRTRLHKSLKRFGQPVQRSVFECDINAAQFRQMQSAVASIIEPCADQVRYYELCAPCHKRVRRLGPGAAVTVTPLMSLV